MKNPFVVPKPNTSFYYRSIYNRIAKVLLKLHRTYHYLLYNIFIHLKIRINKSKDITIDRTNTNIPRYNYLLNMSTKILCNLKTLILQAMRNTISEKQNHGTFHNDESQNSSSESITKISQHSTCTIDDTSTDRSNNETRKENSEKQQCYHHSDSTDTLDIMLLDHLNHRDRDTTRSDNDNLQFHLTISNRRTNKRRKDNSIVNSKTSNLKQERKLKSNQHTTTDVSHSEESKSSTCCVTTYMSSREMTPLQERWNALTMLPSLLFCIYFVLGGKWLTENDIEEAKQSLLQVEHHDSVENVLMISSYEEDKSNNTHHFQLQQQQDSFNFFTDSPSDIWWPFDSTSSVFSSALNSNEDGIFFGISHGCIHSTLFPNLHTIPPMPILAIALGILLHTPFSMVYHWFYAASPSLPPSQKINHLSRRLDQAFIHVCSAFISYGTSGRLDFFFLNLLYNLECIYRLLLPKVSLLKCLLQRSWSIMLWQQSVLNSYTGAHISGPTKTKQNSYLYIINTIHTPILNTT